MVLWPFNPTSNQKDKFSPYNINTTSSWQGVLKTNSRASLVGDVSLYSWDLMCVSGWYCKDKLLSGLKGLIIYQESEITFIDTNINNTPIKNYLAICQTIRWLDEVNNWPIYTTQKPKKLVYSCWYNINGRK